MFPIKTIEKENVVVKICTEDIHKITNLITREVNEVRCDIFDILDTQYPDDTMINAGVAKCSDDDNFDLNVGREIAFRKVKLYANLKKKKLFGRVIRRLMKSVKVYLKEIDKLDSYINKDVEALRAYNPKYEINQ